MGGRVAEQIVFDDFTTGAADDLQRASDLAHRMVFQLGMSDTVGPLSYEGRGGGFVEQKTSALSSQTFEMLDQEVRMLIMNAQREARLILEKKTETSWMKCRRNYWKKKPFEAFSWKNTWGVLFHRFPC